MPLFPMQRNKAAEAKIAALRAMTSSDLADIGLKASDVSRLVMEIRARA